MDCLTHEIKYPTNKTVFKVHQYWVDYTWPLSCAGPEWLHQGVVCQPGQAAGGTWHPLLLARCQQDGDPHHYTVRLHTIIKFVFQIDSFPFHLIFTHIKCSHLFWNKINNCTLGIFAMFVMLCLRQYIRISLFYGIVLCTTVFYCIVVCTTGRECRTLRWRSCRLRNAPAGRPHSLTPNRN